MRNQKGILTLYFLIGFAIILSLATLIWYKSQGPLSTKNQNNTQTTPAIISNYPSSYPTSTLIPVIKENDDGSKTYTEPSVNLFQIKVPQGWNILGKTSCGGPNFSSEDGEISMLICFYNYGTSSNAKELSKYLAKTDTLITEEETMIGGEIGIKKVVKNTNSGIGIYSSYIFVDFDKDRNKKPYTLYIVYGDNSIQLPYQNQKVLDDMISSFKFIK